MVIPRIFCPSRNNFCSPGDHLISVENARFRAIAHFSPTGLLLFFYSFFRNASHVRELGSLWYELQRIPSGRSVVPWDLASKGGPYRFFLMHLNLSIMFWLLCFYYTQRGLCHSKIVRTFSFCLYLHFPYLNLWPWWNLFCCKVKTRDPTSFSLDNNPVISRQPNDHPFVHWLVMSPRS